MFCFILIWNSASFTQQASYNMSLSTQPALASSFWAVSILGIWHPSTALKRLNHFIFSPSFSLLLTTSIAVVDGLITFLFFFVTAFSARRRKATSVTSTTHRYTHQPATSRALEPDFFVLHVFSPCFSFSIACLAYAAYALPFLHFPQELLRSCENN